MSAASVPIDIWQGEDFSAQIIWTDDFDEPQQLIAPARMDIVDQTNQLLHSLATPETPPPEGTIASITLSENIGMIQLHIPYTVTQNFVPGDYHYDLFVTVSDGGTYATAQRVPLIYGPVTVNKRTTVMT